MTKEETAADVGRMTLAYEQLIRKRVCLRRRLREHATNLSYAIHALSHWDDSGHTKDILDLLDAAKTDAAREDVEAMVQVEKEITQTEADLREFGITSVISSSHS